MKLFTALFFSFLFISSNTFCQTCLLNLDHPGYSTLSQVSSGDTLTREYILHIPTNYNSNQETPLIINMHGFGACAADYFESIGTFYEFNALADRENFIVAYPQGAYRPEKEDHYWEPGDNGKDDIMDNDVYFIEQLVSSISNDYNVDPTKVYACGYSNGGMMAYSLACNSSELFSAIGVMSGVMLEEDCTLEQAIPIISFHGIADEVLPYEGNLWYRSVAEIVNFWLDQNDIPANSLISTELNEGKVERDHYESSDGSTCFTLYTINEEWDKPGDHVWFSDEIEDLSPNEILWQFFSDSCQPISSVQNSMPKQAFTIRPNPLSDHLTIESNISEDLLFRIYNLQGAVMLSGKLKSDTYTIDVSSLPSQMYILNVGGQVVKLIKQEE